MARGIDRLTRLALSVEWPAEPNVDRGDLRTAKGAFDYHVERILCPVGGTLAKRIFSMLPAGGACEPHIDYDATPTRVRVHVPLVTNDDCFFHYEDEAIHMEVGSAYVVDPSRKHWIENRGETDRIHLILDYLTPEGAFVQNVRRIT